MEMTAIPYDIPLNSLDDFVVDVVNLTYGNNPSRSNYY